MKKVVVKAGEGLTISVLAIIKSLNLLEKIPTAK